MTFRLLRGLATGVLLFGVFSGFWFITEAATIGEFLLAFFAVVACVLVTVGLYELDE